MSTDVLPSPAFDGHEAVHFFSDRKTGLRSIVAIHSTARGPACGGTRMWDYESPAAALDDVLLLSRAMSYKNAIADLDLGGGKAVIIGSSASDKSPELLEAFGRAINQLGGRYLAAEDMGISPADLALAGRHTEHVVGLDGTAAGSGDPSPVTADGVFRGIRIALKHAYGTPDLAGRRIAVQGVGHVGGNLCDRLAAAGAQLLVCDVNRDLALEVAQRTGAEVIDPADFCSSDAHVLAPCARGGVIADAVLPYLRAGVIAGAANNQLARPELGRKLLERGIIYAPDYAINGGGIINVAAEVRARQTGTGYDPEWVEGKLKRLMETLDDILSRSIREDRAATLIADEIALERLGRSRDWANETQMLPARA